MEKERKITKEIERKEKGESMIKKKRDIFHDF